ncbi:MAG: hypothetical protein ACJAYU_005055 [Bradymonadia bacterium]
MSARLYVDGAEVGSATLSAASGTGCELVFGYPDDGQTDCTGPSADEFGINPLRAQFDDIHHYSRALSANEIRTIYLN